MVKTNNILLRKSDNAISEKELLLKLIDENKYLKYKYALEPIVASILFLILLPLMVIIYFTILLVDRQNPLFMQERPGINTHSFFIYKFKTMKDLYSRSYVQSDNEITILGSFLRKWKLDELPQLINVIRGEMSLIGPRPEPLEYYIDIIDEHPNYKFKYLVKPGLTGYAQLDYYNSTSTIEGAMEKFSYDIAYIMDMNFRGDVKYLFKTVSVVIRKNVS